MSGTGQGYSVLGSSATTWDNRPYKENNGRPEIAVVLIDPVTGAPIDVHLGEDGDIALAVHAEHLFHTIWNHFFVKNTAVTDTLNGPVSAGGKILILNDATGFIVGDKIDIQTDSTHIHMYREIISIATNTLTIDAGVDIDLPDGSTIIQTSFNMAVDGSTTPVIFTMPPIGTEDIDIMRLLLIIIDDTAASDDKFGGQVALTNGVHIRKNVNNGESFETLAIWKTNKDMKEDMFDVVYSDKAGPSQFGVNGRWTIAETGAVLDLKAENSEIMECVIQDDMTVYSDFQIKMQGHFDIG